MKMAFELQCGDIFDTTNFLLVVHWSRASISNVKTRPKCTVVEPWFLGLVQAWLTMGKQYGQPWLTMVNHGLPYG